jgi:menaquinone-dependent protoporphyrinogen oxidase
LFSSGPGSEVVDTEEQPKELSELLWHARTARPPAVLRRAHRDELGFGERMVVRAAKAPEGDFRDWDEIKAWAAAMAAELARDATAQARDGGSRS